MPWTTGFSSWKSIFSPFRRQRASVAAASSKPSSAVQRQRPTYHVRPESGWMNDPNGPIYYRGKYHLFYQHVPGKSVWDFGIVWGHASSSDLINWEHHPHALEPIEGSLDADGCFSGCCVPDADNGPTILYTGVRKRENPNCGDLPPADQDLNLPFIESQCVATADLGVDNLEKWNKKEAPAIPFPPRSLPLVGWRDPFVLLEGEQDGNWTMLMGSGLKDQGGAVMVYRSTNLSSGWYFDGFLCQGNGDTGAMWECPLLAKLPVKEPKSMPVKPRMAKSTSVGADLFSLDEPWGPVKPRSRRSHSVDMTAFSTAERASFQIPSAVERVEEEGRQHFFCISPDAKENRVLYWLGDYQDGKFIIEEAKGPFWLDMGDVVYAPNVMKDGKGRQLLWGWIRDFELDEAPLRGEQDYSGCLSTPRVLSISDGRLVQEPAPEVAGLRSENQWHMQDFYIVSEMPSPVDITGGQAIELEVSFKRGSAACSGLLFKSFEEGLESAALVFDWDSSMLEIIVDPSHFSAKASGTRRTGGRISLKEGSSLDLRIFIDYSCIEIFSGTGEVLTTRVYRGSSTQDMDARIDFVSVGGDTYLVKGSAYEVQSIWEGKDKLPASQLVEKETKVEPEDTSKASFAWWPSWTATPALEKEIKVEPEDTSKASFAWWPSWTAVPASS